MVFDRSRDAADADPEFAVFNGIAPFAHRPDLGNKRVGGRDHMRRKRLKLRFMDTADRRVRKWGQQNLALRRAKRRQMRAGLRHDVEVRIRLRMGEHERFAAIKHTQRRGFARRFYESFHRLLCKRNDIARALHRAAVLKQAHAERKPSVCGVLFDEPAVSHGAQ